MERQGKIALVTGASSGLGKAIASRLLKDGLCVIGAARRVQQMNDLKSEGAHTFELDITDEKSRKSLVSRIMKEFGGVDILVNNAGFGLYGAVEDIPLEDARYQFDVNLFGAAAMIKLLVPQMREKRAGKIINISSMGGKIYTPMGAWYHASKHALEGLSDCLRLELKQFGIDVIVIEPGIIETEFGNVLEGPMIKYSGDTAYGPMARKVGRATLKTYQAGAGSGPEIIAAVVSRAVNTKNPRTRYAAGKYAKLMIGLRNWLGDRAFDRILMATVNRASTNE